jgi:hypothetical protein
MIEKSGRLAGYLSHIAQAIERVAAYLEGVSHEAFVAISPSCPTS